MMGSSTVNDNPQTLLQQVFGFSAFRPLQEQVVQQILNHQDVLLILPTGGGKSLCYQLPALLMPGVVIVISPLLALMQDQLQGLKAKGISATMLSSMQTAEEIRQRQHDLRNDLIKVCFIAPERLQNRQFLDFLSTLNLAFFAVDEAHCVSEWGHEFRADYRQLGKLKQHFPHTSVAAFTATATQRVQQDIVQQLQFNNPENVVRGPVYRDNLFINVQPREKNGYQQLLDFLQQHPNEQGIIYTLSRKNTEDLSLFLQQKQFKARCYHAGLNTRDRQQAFEDFVNDDIDIMVATIAFGMGIDKSNIRFVVHMSLPKTMEAYYQEMGRAGRDGLPSEVLLLYSSGDLGLLSQFINDIDDPDYRQLAYQKLDLIKKYAYQEGCRHQSLSHYFDDVMEDCQTGCDNCLNPDTDKTDISVQAQMFLSAIYRMEQNFGQLHIIDVLTGSKNQKVLTHRHDKLSVYRIGYATHKKQWRIIADRLLELDAIMLGEFNTLKLTDLSRPILKGELAVDIRSSHLKTSEKTATRKQRVEKYSANPDVFEKLRRLRYDIAHAENMPAYIIFDDKTLREMAHFQPQTADQLLQINGVGKIKLEKYGQQFLQCLHSPDKNMACTV